MPNCYQDKLRKISNNPGTVNVSLTSAQVWMAKLSKKDRTLVGWNSFIIKQAAFKDFQPKLKDFNHANKKDQVFLIWFNFDRKKPEGIV